MPSTRRRFAYVAAALSVGIGGCSDRLNTEFLQTIQLDLLNQTDTSLTFHFVLESEGELGQWREFTLDSGGRREVSFQPAIDREWSGYHAVAGDQQVSGSLLGQGAERSCLQLEYQIQKDRIAATLPTDQSLCDND